MAEMNVVPYIDVTLVLLIIFMITAPLITQGVKVEPAAGAVRSDRAAAGRAGDRQHRRGGCDLRGSRRDPEESIDEQTLVTRVAGIKKYKPKTEFLVRGDTGVPYGRVVEVMALMQGAGLDSVGLLTQPPTE